MSSGHHSHLLKRTGVNLKIMKAVCWYGKHDVLVENVPDPEI